MDAAEKEFQKIYEDNCHRITRYLRRLVGEARSERCNRAENACCS
ncbi:MAG: hypothetical protein M0042_16960 [Nitrospiraceae bacterium]|nr:hypothetical protein [Nitrospiraceae bacterium]